MNLIQKYKNWRNSAHPAKISFNRILLVIQAYWRKFLNKNEFNIPTHIIEQHDYRMSIIPKECKEADYCVLHCGCALDKLWDDEECICYPAMKSEKEWEDFKQTL